MIEIREVKNKKDLKKFVKFPTILYRDDPNNLPQLSQDEVAEFTKGKNDAFTYCKSKQWIAYKDGKMVGRIAAIINEAYDQKTGKKQIRFSRYDAIEDLAVVRALFDKVFEYGKQEGKEEIIGPMGFCDLDKQGMVVEGFDHPNIYLTTNNPKYQKDQMEYLGFEKEVDWVEYLINVPKEKDKRISKVANYAMKKYGYHIKDFGGNKNEAAKEIVNGMHIMNEVYSHLYGYVKLTDKQILDFSKSLKLIINLEYLCGVYSKDNELVGYGLLVPGIAPAFKKSKGKLTIGSIIKLNKLLKHNKSVDLYSMGVKKEYQNTGVNAIILDYIHSALIKNKIEVAETGPELESNVQIQAQWKDFEKKVVKRRRLWKLKMSDYGKKMCSCEHCDCGHDH